MPKVSVIIPAYNAMQYLPETFSSAISQTFKDFEIIIINDGSSDGIDQWFFETTDARAQLVSQENQGLAGARNTGIQNATGDYLAFLDADDLWCPSKLEEQVEIFEKNPDLGLVYTWVANINNESQLTGRILQHEIEGDVWQPLTQHNVVECGSVAMVRRECFETCGVFDCSLGSFLEDWDMWLRIAKHYPFKVVKQPLVHYRQHATSASKNWAAMAQSFEIVMEKAFAGAPPELQYLKRKSYGHFNLFCLAWKPLQSQAPDYQKAIYFQQQALSYDPSLKLTQENFRLTLAIALMRGLGPEGYGKSLKLIYKLRQHFLTGPSANSN